MKYRMFGNTGERVSQLGFGAMRMPTVEKDGKKIIDEEKAIALIRKAIDSGVARVIIKHARNLLNDKGTTLI